MRSQRKFPARSLVIAAQVAALMFCGAVRAAAQTDSATRDAETRYLQETAPSKRPPSTFTSLVNFDGTNGVNPNLAPIQGTDGNLYGGTAGGGEYSQGVLYKMTPSGTLTTLYSLCADSGCPDGESAAPEVLGMDGNLYGTTYGGGGLWRWHSLQVHTSRSLDYIAQLRRHGRHGTKALGPVQQRQLLRDHVEWRQPQRVFWYWLWNRVRNDSQWYAHYTL